MLFVFFGRLLAGKPSSVFWKFFFFHLGKLGGQSSGMGSAELLQRFPGGFPKGTRCFLESDVFTTQRLFPLVMFVFWLFSGSCWLFLLSSVSL